jgi:hypothetical protein
MNVTHDNFIGIYENIVSDEYCQSVIEYFENMTAAGYGFNRQTIDNASKFNKDDLSVFATDEKIISLKASVDLQRQLNDVLWNVGYKQYSEKFWGLQSLGSHNSHSFKIQKTEQGQGYHIWHCEAANLGSCKRILAWTLYLNNVEEGGETEFIHQHCRIKPKAGTLVIWPAAFTHVHRGNPPLSNTKYIVTGWIEF